MRQIQQFNQWLKILNIGWDMMDFVYRFIAFCCICMRLYTSTTNNTMNISSIPTGVRSLDSSHWDLFNSLFIDYFTPNIHEDNMYRTWGSRVFLVFSMSLYTSTTNILTNISPIPTGVGSLDFSHWALFNSLFINYFTPNIHGDNAYRM